MLSSELKPELNRAIIESSVSAANPLIKKRQRYVRVQIDDGEGAFGVLFAALLSFWLFFNVLDTSLFYVTLSNVNVTRLTVALLLIACDFAAHPVVFSQTRLDSRRCIIYCITIVLVCACLATKQFLIASSVLVAFASRNHSVKWLLRIWLISISVAIAIIVFSGLVGIIPDYTLDGRGLFGRHSLGFNYTTFLSHYILGVVCCVLALKRRETEAVLLIALFLVSLIVYLFTNSRNSFLLTSMLLIGCAFTKYFRLSRNRVPAFVKWIFRYGFIVCAIVSVIVFLGFNSNTEMGSTLNQLLSGRVKLTQTAYANYPVSLLANDVKWATPHVMEDGTALIGYSDGDSFVEAGYFYVDCSYLNILISVGVIVFVGSLILLTAMTRGIGEMNDNVLGALVFVIAVHSIIDPQLLMLHYNPFLLLLFKFIHSNSTKRLSLL